MPVTPTPISDSVRVSEPLTEALKMPVVESVRVMESDTDPSRLTTFVVLSLSVRASDASPERSCPAVLLNGAAENGEKPNIA
jgi:hypothetical protein